MQRGTEMMNNLSVGLKRGTGISSEVHGTLLVKHVNKSLQFFFRLQIAKKPYKLGACMHAYSGLSLYMPCVWENNSYSPSQSGHCWTIASFVSQGIVHDKQLVSLINNY